VATSTAAAAAAAAKAVPAMPAARYPNSTQASNGQAHAHHGMRVAFVSTMPTPLFRFLFGKCGMV